MSILRRNFVPDQGRKTSLSELRKAFPDEDMGQKAKQKGITYFLSVPKSKSFNLCPFATLVCIVSY